MIAMNEKEEKVVECRHSNGAVTYVPASIFSRIVMEMQSKPSKYVTYREGAKMYRMSEKFFREWVNEIGAAKHISANKVIVSVEKVDKYLEYL